MKNLLFLLLMTVSLSVFAAKPVIDVPALPPDEKLEPFEYDDEVYVPKVLEAYGWCIILQTQLEILGVEPVTKIYEPTYDDLADLELDVIKKYHQKALALEKEVIQAPEDLSQLEIEELRKKVSELKFEKLKWKKEAFALTLETQDIEFYKKRNEEFIAESDSLRLYADSVRYYYYHKMNAKIDEIKSFYEEMFSNNRIPLITIAGTANKFRFDNDFVENDLAPGAIITLNTHPFLKYGKYIDLWAEYINPELRTYTDISDDYREMISWKTNFYTFGVNANFTDLIRTYYFNLGFKVGAGFYWGESDPLNLNIPKANWKGELVRLELNLENQRFNLPVELFGSCTFLFPSKDMNFGVHDNIIPKSETFQNISIGFRINLWNVPDREF
jgi:hypothetical protein